MNSKPYLEYALEASQQLLLNCYLREVDAVMWYRNDGLKEKFVGRFADEANWIVEIPIERLRLSLILEVTHKSKVLRHKFRRIYMKHDGGSEYVEVSFVTVLSLLNECVSNKGGAFSNLTSKTINFVRSVLASCAAMGEGIEEASKRDLNEVGFIKSEQNGVLGHWFHPTPRSRIGMNKWEEEIYCPDYGGKFQLHYFFVRDVLFKYEGVSKEDYVDYLSNCLGDDMMTIPRGFTAIAVHPVQAKYLKSCKHVKGMLSSGNLLEIGEKGIEFYATSSVRSVYSSEVDRMMKLSIPVKLTNSVRTNKIRDLEFCRLLSKLMIDEGVNQLSKAFELILDDAYCSVTCADVVGESGFEVLLRSNPFPQNKGGQIVNPVTLFQDGIMGVQSQLQCLVEKYAKEEDIPVPLAAQLWFEIYIDCSLIQLLKVFDAYGIVFESHLQNCLIELDGLVPNKLYSRDTEGSYIINDRELELLNKYPSLGQMDGVFFSAEEVYDVVSYYLIINHIFAVVNRFGCDELLPESLCLEIIVRKLRVESRVAGQRSRGVIDYLLEAETLRCKSNLLTQLDGIDELDNTTSEAIYIDIDNPLKQSLYKKSKVLKKKVNC